MVPGDHGTTYGGNPFAAAAINAVFDQFEKLQVPEHAKEIGAYLWDKLEELKERHDCITGHRGIALMQGLEFNKDLLVFKEIKCKVNTKNTKDTHIIK